ncbi:MAG: aromatic amino acid lyase [Alphaproteobacteria bacterium]
MPISRNARSDFSLENFRRVAWQGEPVAFTSHCRGVMEEARRRFLAMLETDPNLFVYGVTTRYGEGAKTILDAAGRAEMAKEPAHTTGLGMGEPLPDRVVRGIILARLANYVEGYSAISPPMAQRVADMLDGRPLPVVPRAGQDASGETANLYNLFWHLLGEDCAEKDNNCLVNGSPCAAALAADSALVAANRVRLATRVFALSADAIGAPLEHFDPALAALWGDETEGRVLNALTDLLAGGDAAARRTYQAPVSYRVLPRVLAGAYRAADRMAGAATTSLRAFTDNPMILPPDDTHPAGRAVHNGGFHNGMAYPAMNGLAEAWADLAVLAGIHISKFEMPQVTGLDARLSAGNPDFGLGFALDGGQRSHARRARLLATPTLLSGDLVFIPQTDTTVPTWDAWEKEREAGEALDACLTVLSVKASQVLAANERLPAPPLRAFLDGVRQLFPPVTSRRNLGQEATTLARAFTVACTGGDFAGL